MLSKFEKKLDCKLFDRIKNKIYLNENGKKTLEYVNVILNEIELLKKDVKKTQSMSNEIIIGSPSPSVTWYFSSKLRKYLPNMFIDTQIIEQDNIKKMLDVQSIDMALSMENIKSENIISMPYAEIRHYLTVHPSHPLAKYNEVELENIKGLYFLTMGGKATYLGKNTIDFINVNNLGLKVYKATDTYSFYDILRNYTRYIRLSNNMEIQANYDVYRNRKIISVKDHLPRLPVYVSYLKNHSQTLREIINVLDANHKEIMI